MKIYTKGGDKGKTSLIGGERVDKYDLRVEAYGTLDELKSYIGLIRDLSEDKALKERLIDIQNQVFVCESRIACCNEEALLKMPAITEDEISALEEDIDEINANSPKLTHFVLPGGHPIASYCHIARTICRRAERAALRAYDGKLNDPMVGKYINRLSDYLFALARYFAYKLGEGEIKWKPTKRG